MLLLTRRRSIVGKIACFARAPVASKFAAKEVSVALSSVRNLHWSAACFSAVRGRGPPVHVSSADLVSWVDALPTELPDENKLENEMEQKGLVRDDDDEDDVEFDRVADIVAQSGLGTQLGSVLTKLGVRSVADLNILKEEDLVSCGIAVIPARKFINSLSPTRQKTSAPSPSVYGLYSAEETMKLLAKKGVASAERSNAQVLCSSFLGGSLLGFGCSLTTVVAGGASHTLAAAPGLLSLLSGAVFPVGLSMVVLSGSELVTGNFMTMALPAFTHPGVDRETVLRNLSKVWALSGIGNLAGSIFIAGAMYELSVVSAGTYAATWLTALAVKKCTLPMWVAVGKGILANWLVNVAIFQAQTAHTSAGKIASLWLPIMTFVALGLEHSVANMCLLPLGWMLGADVTLLSIAGNIIPVAVGNALGAIVFVAGVQRYSIMRGMVHRAKSN